MKKSPLPQQTDTTTEHQKKKKKRKQICVQLDYNQQYYDKIYENIC